MSDQGVDVYQRACPYLCNQNDPLFEGTCECGCQCGHCPVYNFYIDRHYECCYCPPPPPPPPPPSACFPSFAKVNLDNGKSKTMSELQLGDRVQTISSSGNLMFSEVKTFLKKQKEFTTTYKSIETDLNNTICMTGDHLIYARKDSDNSFNQMYANEVSVGDEVMSYEEDELIPTRVINVSEFTLQGAFTPITMEGNIVVNDVLASCYAFGNHDVAHIGMTLIRWFPRMIGLVFGEDNGLSIYASTTEEMAKWLLLTGTQ